MNIEYRKIKSGSFVLVLTAQLADSPIKTALADGYASLSKTYPLQKIPSSKFAEVYKFSDGTGVFYFKMYHCRSAWDYIKHLFRPMRASRAFLAAQMLKKNGFFSPDIVGIGHRNKVFERETFLLTRELQNALSVEMFFKNQQLSVPFAEKRKFIKIFGSFVGRLHSKNISHGDLRLSNVLARKTESEYEFFLLDNERTIQYLRLPGRLRLKNLVQVNMFRSAYLTRTDRLRFFKSYLSENPNLAAKWKELAAKVHNKTDKRLKAKNRSVTVR